MNTIDIKTFNAVGDGKTNDTQAIQNAIDKTSAESTRLIISAGTYNIGTLIIKSNSDIIIEEGAVLNGIAEIEAYADNTGGFVDAVGRQRGKALIIMNNAKNVSIDGKGTIRGNGSDLKSDERPFLFRLSESENIKISGIKLESSPSWCLHIEKCNNLDVDDITIYNRGCPNNDGIDIDSSENITITNCDISSGDDGICIKATSKRPCKNISVKNCKVSTDWGAFKIGTESVGDFSDISIEDCYFYDVTGGGIKIVPTDGAVVDNITIKNIKMDNCTGPIFIANGERNREYAGEYKDTFSRIRNVEISGITADIVKAPLHCYYEGEEWGNALGGIILSGTEKNKLDNIRISDSAFSLPGGYTGEIPQTVREMEKLYPEFHRFDPVPAKGVYVRHANNIEISNIKMIFKEDDTREEIFTEDADIKVI